MFVKAVSNILPAKNALQIRNFLVNMMDTKKIIPGKTLILFDLDLTIFDRPGIMSDLYPVERKDFLDAIAKEDPSLVDVAYAQATYKLIETEMLTTNKMLRDNGFIVLGFTSRRTGKAKASSTTTVEEDACFSLKQLGVTFSKIPSIDFDIPENAVQLENPNLRSYELIGKPKIFGEQYDTSTIFTANYPKGLIIEHVLNYLSNSGIEIEDIVEVDDNIKYLQNLKLVCENLNKNFVGLHYTYANDHKSALSQEIIEIQKKYLLEHKQFLAEEDAIKLINQKMAHETFQL